MIEIRHLRYFIAAAEELNFRKAAERIHIDQTPLSRTVTDLEARWGVALFVRGGHRLQLTPAGVKLLNHARKLLIRLERIRRAVRATHTLYREPLRIGVDEVTMHPMLAECLIRWRRTAAEIPLEITEMRTPELIRALQKETIDVGFSSLGASSDDSVTRRPAWCTPLVGLTSPEHELAGREVVSLTELLAYPVVTYSLSDLPGLHHQMTNILAQHSLLPTTKCAAKTVAGCLTQVAIGQGVGIIGAEHVRESTRKDVVVIPLIEQVDVVTYVLHKELQSGSSQVQRFVTHATISR